MRGFLNRHISTGPVDPGPLDHPCLQGLSPRELADLPLPRWRSEVRDPAAEGTGGKRCAAALTPAPDRA